MGQTVVYDTQVPSGATILNGLLGTNLQTAPYNGLLHVYGREEATAAGKIRVDLVIGNEIAGQNMPMTRDDKLSPNRLEDFLGSWPVVQGQAIIPTIREVGGAAMDLNVVFDLEQIPIEEVIRLAGG